jgi:acetyl esterase
MSLDVNVRALLEQVKAAALPKLWELGPQAARAAMKSSFFRGGDTPIGRTEDRIMPGPACDIRLRIYTPGGTTEALLPGLMFFHGGGFVIGDLDTHDDLCRSLANQSGCRVVSVDYRLAPECCFPAAVEDCFAATKHVAAHGPEFGVRADQFAVGGDSAGGRPDRSLASSGESRGSA